MLNAKRLLNVLTEIYFQWSKCLCPKSNKYYILPWWQTSDKSITKLKFKLLLRKMTKISKIHLHNRNWRSFKDFIHLQWNLHNINFFLSLRLSKTQLRQQSCWATWNRWNKIAWTYLLLPMVVLDPGMARTRKMEMMPARYAYMYYQRIPDAGNSKIGRCPTPVPKNN